MTTDILIRTYEKDLDWLGYALKSIHKHVTGWRRIVIAIPKGQGHLLSHLTAETVIEVDDLPNGYIGQQLTKMEAWKYTDADAVLFWDSDVIATEPHDVAEYFKEGKPILWCTPWDKVGDAICWKGCTEQALGFEPPFEYMRRMPVLHLRGALVDCYYYVERTVGKSLERYLSSVDRFSEFNVIGAFVHQFQHKDYAVINTEEQAPPPQKIFQGWSWGGITEEVKQRLKQAGL